jgi:predicted restriction endonuclease
MCCICGWNESTVDMAHIISHVNGGSCWIDNIIPLCPNHHRVLDRGIASEIHSNAIHSFITRIYARISELPTELHTVFVDN